VDRRAEKLISLELQHHDVQLLRLVFRPRTVPLCSLLPLCTSVRLSLASVTFPRTESRLSSGNATLSSFCTLEADPFLSRTEQFIAYTLNIVGLLVYFLVQKPESIEMEVVARGKQTQKEKDAGTKKVVGDRV
jgi:hypothetical protein